MILFQAHSEWRFNAPDSSFLGFSIFLEGVTVVESNKGVPRIGVSGNGTVERFILAFDPERCFEWVARPECRQSDLVDARSVRFSAQSRPRKFQETGDRGMQFYWVQDGACSSLSPQLSAS